MADDKRPTDAAATLRFGLIMGVIAYTLWGLMPIYIKSVNSVPAFEVVAHRILWSVPFGALILSMRKQWREVITAFCTPRIVWMLGIASASMGANWCIYVWAVQADRVLEASLGYYINPLMYVAAGVLIFGEKLRRAQIAAVILAGASVLTLTVGAGVFPWVSLALAILFTTYGYIRKTTIVGAMPGLFIETMLLSPVALLYLLWLINNGNAVFLSGDMGIDTLLMLAGPVTVIPLVTFALAARRLHFSTIGFLQYIGPSLQFALGIYYGEAFTLFHGVCFGLIWIALAIFSVDAARASRAAPMG